MKKVMVILLLITAGITTNAQPPIHDTLWGESPNREYYHHILRATSITGQTQQIIINPTQEPFCFDTKITIHSTIGGRVSVDQCLYMNTKDGLVGYLKPVRGAGANMCDIKTDDENFSFTVMSLKGNVYIYHNTKPSNELKHWVSTGNTQENRYLYNEANTNQYTLHKKAEQRNYCGGKITATCYKYDGATAPTMFLFGKSYPGDITVTPFKYLGNFGIGYQQSSDRGLYIIMENEVGNSYDCKITSIEEVNVCFDPTPFRKQEDDFREKALKTFDKERISIAKAEEDAHKGSCNAEKLAIVALRKQFLLKQEENIRNSTHGNVYQDQVTQTSYLNMMDPIQHIQMAILDTKLSICGTTEARDKHPEDPSFADRLACLNMQLGKLEGTEENMRLIDQKYQLSPQKALPEKSKLYLQVMGSISCN